MSTDKRLRVLHLEDDAHDAELIAATLLEAGVSCDIVRVDTEEDFIRALENDFDLILADYSLPSFDGLSALRIVTGKFLEVPFIFISGAMGEELAIESLQLGAKDYVLKNRLSRLPSVVRRALDEHQEYVGRRQAEMELERLRHQNELILNSADEGVIGLDLEGKVTFANPSAAQMLGRGIGELIEKGHDIWHHTKPDGSPYPAEKCPITSAYREGTVSRVTDEVFWKKDGTSFPVAYTGTPIFEDGILVGAVVTFRDITRRKLTEESLKRSEQRFRQLAENLPAAVYRLSLHESRMSFFNEMIETMTGYSADEMEKGEICHIDRMILEEDRSSVLAEVRQAIAEDRPFHVEYRLRHKNGDIRYFLERGRPVRRDGETRCIDGVIFDITEKKAAEHELQRYREGLEKLVEERTAELSTANRYLEREIEGRKCVEIALRQSEMLLQKVLENLPVGVSILDEKGRTIRMNKEFERVWAGAEYVGVDQYGKYKLFRCDTGESVTFNERPGVKALLYGETTLNEEFVIENFDGVRKTVLVSGVPLMNEEGKVTSVVMVNQDISDRKQAEEAVRRSEELLRTFMNSTRDVMFLKDEKLRHIFVNEAYLKSVQVKVDQVIGKTVFDFCPLWVAEQCTESDRRAQNSETPILAEERTEDTFFETCKFRVELGDQLFGVGGFARDITDRKRAERELRELTDELKRSNNELKQFAYVASHDLQQPLTIIIGSLQILCKRWGDKLEADVNELISYAVDSGKTMQRLIRELLEYSQVGGKGLTLKPVETSLALHHALANLQVLIDETMADIHFGDLPQLMADGSQITRLFQNLIGNSLKYRGSDRPKIHVSARAEARKWIFSVKDNGIGIDQKHADRIFGIFQRLHTREEYPGTGLGLAICKKIVELHGGRIWVESARGAGSTFLFTIPATD